MILSNAVSELNKVWDRATELIESDQRLRELERRWHSGSDPETAAAYHTALMHSGKSRTEATDAIMRPLAEAFIARHRQFHGAVQNLGDLSTAHTRDTMRMRHGHEAYNRMLREAEQQASVGHDKMREMSDIVKRTASRIGADAGSHVAASLPQPWASWGHRYNLNALIRFHDSENLPSRQLQHRRGDRYSPHREFLHHAEMGSDEDAHALVGSLTRYDPLVETRVVPGTGGKHLVYWNHNKAEGDGVPLDDLTPSGVPDYRRGL